MRVVALGVDRRKADKRLCLAVGCVRVAMYRSNARTQRGYCKAHKDVATARMTKYNDSTADYQTDKLLKAVGSRTTSWRVSR